MSIEEVFDDENEPPRADMPHADRSDYPALDSASRKVTEPLPSPTNAVKRGQQHTVTKIRMAHDSVFEESQKNLGRHGKFDIEKQVKIASSNLRHVIAAESIYHAGSQDVEGAALKKPRRVLLPPISPSQPSSEPTVGSVEIKNDTKEETKTIKNVSQGPGGSNDDIMKPSRPGGRPKRTPFDNYARFMKYTVSDTGPGIKK